MAREWDRVAARPTQETVSVIQREELQKKMFLPPEGRNCIMAVRAELENHLTHAYTIEK